MPTPLADRVQKRRDALRSAGLRPIQIWVPDARRPGFEEECRRQAQIVAAADTTDRELSGLLDAVLLDLDAESEV